MIERGDVYFADLDPVVGSEQGGLRPVLVIGNNIGNKHSPTVIVAAITSKQNKNSLPTHINILLNDETFSVVLTEQLRTIDKIRLYRRIGTISLDDMERVSRAIEISLAL